MVPTAKTKRTPMHIAFLEEAGVRVCLPCRYLLFDWEPTPDGAMSGHEAQLLAAYEQAESEVPAEGGEGTVSVAQGADDSDDSDEEEAVVERSQPSLNVRLTNLS